MGKSTCFEWLSPLAPPTNVHLDFTILPRDKLKSGKSYNSKTVVLSCRCELRRFHGSCSKSRGQLDDKMQSTYRAKVYQLKILETFLQALSFCQIKATLPFHYVHTFLKISSPTLVGVVVVVDVQVPTSNGRDVDVEAPHFHSPLHPDGAVGAAARTSLVFIADRHDRLNDAVYLKGRVDFISFNLRFNSLCS